MATGVLTFLINGFLHLQTGHPVEGGIIDPLVGLITIVMVGRLSDLSRRLASQLHERQIADKRIETNELKYRLLFEMETDCIGLIDRNTFKIYEINQAATELFGYTRTELLDINALDLSAEPEKSDFSMRKGDVATPVRFLRKKDGSVFPAEISRRHFEINGQAVSLLKVKDITEKLEFEKQQMRIHKQHIQSQKLEAIGTLAGGIAHDFNNILGAILGYSDLLKIQEIPWSEKASAYLEQIRNATFRAKELVNQILTFSRIPSVSMKTPVMAIPIIKEALKLLRATIPAQINISQRFEAKKDTVVANATQIHQVIINLCTNAYQAIPSRNGTIDILVSNILLDEKFVEIHPEMEMGNYLQISVQDTGHGMEPEVLEKIFQPYFTTKKNRGSGLGLSVVHGIVRNHQGCITVESNPGKGSCFSVFLPLAIADVDMDGKPAQKIQGGTEKILLVDDEPALLEMTKDTLQMVGYSVESRTSSLEALALIKAKPFQFDMLVTDMNMPHMTGIELRQQVAKLAPDLPVIILTGFSENLDNDKAIKIGFKRMIMKPVSFFELTDAIRGVLDERRISQTAT